MSLWLANRYENCPNHLHMLKQLSFWLVQNPSEERFPTSGNDIFDKIPCPACSPKEFL